MKIIKTIAISTFIAATSLLCDAREFQDWSNFRRYHDSNTEVKALPAAERQVVFLGNSITDNWARFRPDFSNRTAISDAESRDRPPISSYRVSVKM